MIRVVSHDPNWATAFAHEAAAVAQALGGVAFALHHIGSTAVPGLAAKPVIDLLLEVDSLAALDAATPALVARGYEAKGEFGLPGRRYFRRDDADGRRTHQLHAYLAATPSVRRHLAFRDYLRAHAGLATQYGALKQKLAAEHPYDAAAYVRGKDAFVRDIERRALRWQAGCGDDTDV